MEKTPSGGQSASERRAQVLLKRAFDVAVSCTTLLIAGPVIALAALLVWLEDRGPVLFRQKRVGASGECFEMVKLRSMAVNAAAPDSLGQVRTDHPLVTRTGRLIRRAKIDELPQLWNVLKGEMSMVGPRPTLPEQVERYDAFQRRRLEVRPGLSGWAQVCGNTELSWEQRILLDVWYIDHWSLWLDVKILARTVHVSLFGERTDADALAAALAHANRPDRRRA